MERLLKAAVGGILTGALGLGLTLFSLGIDLEEDLGLHLLFKLRGVKQPPPEVVVVAVDKASSDDLHVPNDPRKWPRSFHARLTETLAKEGAAVIAFDIFFDETKSTEEDASFARAIHAAGNVVLSEYLEMERVSLIDKQRGPPRDLTILKVIPPFPSLAQSAVALAPFPLSKVPVKVHQYWTFKTGAGDTPTLPVVAFQIFALDVYDDFVGLLKRVEPTQSAKLPRHREEVVQGKGVERMIQDIREIFEDNPRIADRMLNESRGDAPLSRDPRRRLLLRSLIKMYQRADRVYLNFYGSSGTIFTIPYGEILRGIEKGSGAGKPFDFKGKAVFIGQSERFRLGQKDGFYTVFSQSNGLDLSGVEIAATAFSNLLTDQPVHPLNRVSNFFLIFFWGMSIGMIFLLLPTAIAAASAIGLSLLYLLFARSQFNTTATWYPIIVPLLVQFPVAFFGAVLWQYVISNKERQNIRKAFGYYLPNGVVDQLSKNIANIKTSHQVVYGICLSTDAEHYTSLSEAMDPTELGNFMNRYYEAVFKPIKQRAGIIANVLGDSVLALWVASHSDTPLRKEACLAALEIAEALRQFNQSSVPYTLPTRIGLHSGPLLLRHIGAMDHYEYRPVGDIVNTATRIEGLNKYLGTQILVSEEVIRQLDDFLAREIGTFLLAGKSKPLVVHGLLCPKEDTDTAHQKACAFFAEALMAFRKQSWDEAIEKFGRAGECFGQDGPSAFYVRLCREYRANPPGPMWDGAVHMERK
jgi:adenylate cyclase